MRRGNIRLAAGLLLILAAVFLAGYNLWEDDAAGDAAELILGQIRDEIPEDPVPAEGRLTGDGAAADLYPDSMLPSDDTDSSEDSLWDGTFPAGLYWGTEMEYPDYILNPDMDLPGRKAESSEEDKGSSKKKAEEEIYAGVITIPSVGRELPVYREWSYPHLKKGPCRYTGTPYQDDLVICGHNYVRHFGPIKSLHYGDEVLFTDMDGNVFRYKVAEIVTLQPDRVDELINTDWDLTLVTCTLGGATRVTVRCQRADKPGA